MATLSAADQLTPIEVAKRFSSKETQTIVESLAVTDQFLLDSAIFEASDGTLNKTVQRVALPTGTHRIYGQGIAAHASQTRQLEDRICMLEDYSDVDADMADHSPNKKALLEGEDKAFLMGMGQTMTENLVYGNFAADPASINGLAVRYPSLVAGSVKAATANNGTSGWLIGWGKQRVHLFYPRGHESLGIKREFRGKIDATVVDPTTHAVRQYPAYRTFFSAHYGLAVRDARAVKRVCNITSAVDGLVVLKALVELRNKMPPGEGNLVFYCNATVKTLFDTYALTAANMCYRTDDHFGRPVTMFQDIRIRQVDELIDTEVALT